MKHDAAPAEALLGGLERVRAAWGRVRFGATGPSGVRRADVETERDAAGAVLLYERGRFRFDDGREIPYTDAVCLSVRASGIEVSHLRRGRGQPVGLVRLAPREDGTLVSVAPHRCGADEYTLVARAAGTVVELEWTVRGPAKRGSILVRYAPSAEFARAFDTCSSVGMPASIVP